MICITVLSLAVREMSPIVVHNSDMPLGQAKVITRLHRIYPAVVRTMGPFCDPIVATNKAQGPLTRSGNKPRYAPRKR